MGSEMEKKCAHPDTPVWTLAHVQYAQGAEGKPGAESGEVLKCSLGAVSLCGVFRMSAPFEERSRVVPCRTPMGKLRVPIELQVPRALVHRTSSVACRVGTWLWPWVAARSLREIADDGTWTLEDTKMVLIVLTKTKRGAANCWTSLLESEYAADPWLQDQIQRKLTLERFQKENPGFDFSGAEISGNHTNGGPDFSNLEK